METTVAPRRSAITKPFRRRPPTPALYGGLALVGAVVVCLAILGGLRLARPGALPGVVVGDVEVGGLAGDELSAAIASAGRGSATFAVTLDEERIEASGAELGYVLDVEATERAVLRRGRQWNPVAALADQLRAFGSTPIVVERVESVDDAMLEGWVADAAEALDAEPVEGTLVFDGTDIERRDPTPGFAVHTGELETLLRDSLLGDGPREVVAPADRTDPETTVEAVDRVFSSAQRALSAPVVLTRGDGQLVLEPADIAGLLAVEQRSPDLELVADPERLDALVDGELRAQLETEPQDARFEIAGDAVEIVPSVDGFRFDAEVAAGQVLGVATGDGDREAELDGERTEPELTTADAEALGIVERVSSFTTHFQAGQSRVTNIQRIADLVGGVVIRPGETFSVNSHVGRRTRDQGFVEGGAIFRGEFVSTVGGGVSQFATTMYNAAYFGGYDIPEFRPHSYYISRYPPGREATLNYPDIDLKVHNNSPHGILVQTSYTGTSVTVTFWGTQWVEVESIAGPQVNHRAPPVEVQENPDRPEGFERVLQSGRSGFDITVTRVLRFPDGSEEREEVRTRYLPEPRIVERGTMAPEPPEEDDDEDAEEDDDGGGDDDTGGGDDEPDADAD